MMESGTVRTAGRSDRRQQVSFDDEPLILVDEHDHEIGFADKGDAHAGRGTLHRAFSIFLFRDPQTVLLHQRSPEKPLWPGFWTNSCCSHPRRGESMGEATQRRLEQELGASCALDFLYKFEYSARFDDSGSEHELCSVYVGHLPDAATLSVNRSEISEWGWYSLAAVDAMVQRSPERFTPWFLLEWRQLRGPFAGRVASLMAATGAAAPTT
jgi:isopentenyl-diphosphate delta-isomerase